MYLILSSDRMALGVRVKLERALELIDKYSKDSIPPDLWGDHPEYVYAPLHAVGVLLDATATTTREAS